MTSQPRRGIVDVLLREGDLAVVLAGLLLLGLGWIARAQFVGRTMSYSGHGVRFEVPDRWTRSGPGKDASVETLFDAWGDAAWKPRVRVRIETLPASVGKALVSDYISLNMGRDLQLFHAIDQRPLEVGGKPAVRYDYAYAVDPIGGIDATDVPVVVRAVALVMIDGAQLTTVDVAAPAAEFDANPARYESIISSVRAAP